MQAMRASPISGILALRTLLGYFTRWRMRRLGRPQTGRFHRRTIMASKRLALIFASLTIALTACQTAPQPDAAEGRKPGVERLYILDCGEGVAGDISRWSPGVNVGKSMGFANSCYLIKH